LNRRIKVGSVQFLSDVQRSLLISVLWRTPPPATNKARVMMQRDLSQCLTQDVWSSAEMQALLERKVLTWTAQQKKSDAAEHDDRSWRMEEEGRRVLAQAETRKRFLRVYVLLNSQLASTMSAAEWRDTFAGGIRQAIKVSLSDSRRLKVQVLFIQLEKKYLENIRSPGILRGANLDTTQTLQDWTELAYLSLANVAIGSPFSTFGYLVGNAVRARGYADSLVFEFSCPVSRLNTYPKPVPLSFPRKLLNSGEDEGVSVAPFQTVREGCWFCDYNQLPAHGGTAVSGHSDNSASLASVSASRNARPPLRQAFHNIVVVDVLAGLAARRKIQKFSAIKEHVYRGPTRQIEYPLAEIATACHPLQGRTQEPCFQGHCHVEYHTFQQPRLKTEKMTTWRRNDSIAKSWREVLFRDVTRVC